MQTIRSDANMRPRFSGYALLWGALAAPPGKFFRSQGTKSNQKYTEIFHVNSNVFAAHR